MPKFFRFAAATVTFALISLAADLALAQNTPAAPATESTTPPQAGAPTPAATSAPAATAPAATAPAATAPAAAAPAAAPTASAPETPATTKHAAKPKRKKTKVGRRDEIERSIRNGAVPARYRRSVPKEYQQYIPFDKQ